MMTPYIKVITVLIVPQKTKKTEVKNETYKKNNHHRDHPIDIYIM